MTARSDRLGNRLGRLMCVRNLSDEELAARAGLSRSQLNRIRNGRTVPRTSTAIALAKALGLRVRDVFCLEPQARIDRQSTSRLRRPPPGTARQGR